MRKLHWLIFILALLAFAFVAYQHPASGTEETASASSSTVRSTESVDAKLERLVRTHPIVQVREDFAGKIMRGEISLDVRPGLGASAAFAVVPRGRVTGHMPPSGAFVQVLRVDSRLLLDASKSDEFWTLVVFHESVHERQYRMGTVAPETFDVTYQPRDAGDAERVCDEKWHAEREAYQEECWLAKKMGAERVLNGLCASVGTPQFDDVLSRALVMGDPSAACRDSFARHVSES